MKIIIDSKKIQGPILNRSEAWLDGVKQHTCSVADEVNQTVVVHINNKAIKKAGKVEIRGLTDVERRIVFNNYM